MTKLRIFYPFVGGATIGGSHVSALGLIRNLDPDRYEPVIALHREAGALGAYISEMGLSYEVLDTPRIIAPKHSRSPQDASMPGFLLRSVPQMVRYLKRNRIDIVHTNDGRMHGSWSLPAKLAGCELIWHHRQGPDAKGANYIAPLLADRILSVSEFSRPEKPLRSIEDRFQVVHSPFDLDPDIPNHAACHKALCVELGVPEDSVLLAYFGVLNDRKRPLHFVDAVKAVRDAMPNRPVHGLIFGRVETEGSGLDQACLDRAAGLGVSANLHMMGFRDPPAPAMAGVDALLVTALDEPFGRTLIEAMHLGTPVVATRHGGNPEAIEDGETGFLVDPWDPKAFSAPVRDLVEHPTTRVRIATAAQQEVRGQYGLDVHVAKTTAVYDMLTG
ncbi:Glycosyltransferase involved in cell wall bisynthesis [Aliiroseovarius halocynthiae]|uniref:Glycosyltransferase family 4 protein n=1 Tax=Aliiroseovarius halocynthiae TaxID=985055 RepID=A0A545SUM6_9RHOB|nr:glycosyltransferase family 4 protein [Aliiroseovarius halocynthiae]TQV68652.1 glycosyltransferase family 4 protein [Aliiroseovarius halocynthiae]SMR71072.1 Glycosyltransferase involved in cell wall bisynthesis [Aliiroseovarius halocynthiae]